MKNKIILLAAALLFASALKAQQPPPPPNGMPPSPQERLKRTSERLGRELALKPTQKQQLEVAYKDFFTSMDKLRGKDFAPPAPPPLGTKAEVDKLVAARDKKIKNILTVAQFKKISANRKGYANARSRWSA